MNENDQPPQEEKEECFNGIPESQLNEQQRAFLAMVRENLGIRPKVKMTPEEHAELRKQVEDEFFTGNENCPTWLILALFKYRTFICFCSIFASMLLAIIFQESGYFRLFFALCCLPLLGLTIYSCLLDAAQNENFEDDVARLKKKQEDEAAILKQKQEKIKRGEDGNKPTKVERMGTNQLTPGAKITIEVSNANIEFLKTLDQLNAEHSHTQRN